MTDYGKNKIIKFIDWFDRFLKTIGYIAGSLVIVMMLSTVRETIGRYFFHAPTSWSLDLCILLFVALVYLGAGYTTSINGHPRADFLYIYYKGKTKVIFDTIIYIISIIYALILFHQGLIMALESLYYNETTSSVFRVPLFPVKILIPLGAIFVVISLVNKIICTFYNILKKGEIKL